MKINIWAIAAGCLWGGFAWICGPPLLKAFAEYQARPQLEPPPYDCTEAAADFNRPWSKRKGIESIDSNLTAILIKAPLDKLSEVLETSAKATQRDVIGVELKSSEQFSFAFQFKGHPWSVITDSNWFKDASIPSPAQLSQTLKQPVIKITINNTYGNINYQVFKNGEIVEYFAGAEGGAEDLPKYNELQLPVQRYVFPKPYGDEPADEQQADFWSSRRTVTAAEIENVWDFSMTTLYDAGAYLPTIDAQYFIDAEILKTRGQYKIINPGEILGCQGQSITAIPDFLRVDYFSFGPKAANGTAGTKERP